jgi:hypothetical protein
VSLIRCGGRHNNAPGADHDEQRDLIQQLAPGAGKTLQGICEAYRVASLKDLTTLRPTS